MENKNYGGLDSEFTAYETAEIVVLPVPYDGTSTWLKGADKGPNAILEASANMELYDIETDSEVYTHGIATLEPVTEASSPEAMSQEVEKQVDKILTDKKFPVILGGEHSVSIGAFRAFAKHYDKFSVLQLDVHSDMRNEYEGSPPCPLLSQAEEPHGNQHFFHVRGELFLSKPTFSGLVFSFQQLQQQLFQIQLY